MSLEKFTDTIIDRLKKAVQSDPEEMKQVDWKMLEEEWYDFVDNIHNHGAVFGLQLAKKAWDKGLGRQEIRENELHYLEEIAEYEEE